MHDRLDLGDSPAQILRFAQNDNAEVISEASVQADEALGRAALGPREALALLKRLEAPVASVERMIEESVTGRYSSS